MMQDTFELVLCPIVVDTRIEQIVENGVVRKLMILGYDKYYITDSNNLFHLVSKKCIDKLGIKGHPTPNVLHYTCEWGIRLIDKSFNGIFKILNKNTVIAGDMENTWGQFIFKEYGSKKYLYDPLLFKQCEERLTKYFPNYNDNGFWSAVLNNTKVENITDDNLMQYAVQHINCGVFKIRHDGGSQFFTNTIKNYVESTTVLPETTAIIDDAFNSTIISVIDNTSSTQQTFIQNITGTAINLINDAITHLTNSTVNTTDYSQVNMLDESDNNTSSTAPYIAIGTVVAASIAVIGAGVTWYVRNKNLKKAVLEQYIAEIEAEQYAAATNENTIKSDILFNNDRALVDITGVSSAEDSTL